MRGQEYGRKMADEVMIIAQEMLEITKPASEKASLPKSPILAQAFALARASKKRKVKSGRQR